MEDERESTLLYVNIVLGREAKQTQSCPVEANSPVGDADRHLSGNHMKKCKLQL